MSETQQVPKGCQSGDESKTWPMWSVARSIWNDFAKMNKLQQRLVWSDYSSVCFLTFVTPACWFAFLARTLLLSLRFLLDPLSS